MKRNKMSARTLNAIQKNGIDVKTYWARIYKGWPPMKAETEPVNKAKSRKVGAECSASKQMTNCEKSPMTNGWIMTLGLPPQEKYSGGAVVTNANRRRMDEIFRSWEFLLREKLEGADRIAANIYRDGGLEGVSAAERSEYIGQKVLEMIEKIASERKVR